MRFVFCQLFFRWRGKCFENSFQCGVTIFLPYLGVEIIGSAFRSNMRAFSLEPLREENQVRVPPHRHGLCVKDCVPCFKHHSFEVAGLETPHVLVS